MYPNIYIFFSLIVKLWEEYVILSDDINAGISFLLRERERERFAFAVEL